MSSRTLSVGNVARSGLLTQPLAAAEIARRIALLAAGVAPAPLLDILQAVVAGA